MVKPERHSLSVTSYTVQLRNLLSYEAGRTQHPQSTESHKRACEFEPENLHTDSRQRWKLNGQVGPCHEDDSMAVA